MGYVLRIMFGFALLAAIIIAPVQSAMASVTFVPTMTMADGSPCPPKNCATMPNCTLALPGGLAGFAIVLPGVSAQIQLALTSDVFAMTDVAGQTLIYGDGLRRPPKI